MKRNVLVVLTSLFLFYGVSAIGYSANTDTLQVHYTALQCDSLIQANVTNPDFAVLDVRTPGEYIPEHLEGAINRDYYSSSFYSQIDLLPRQKMYVIHCQSGGRSGMVFPVMVSMGFTKVIEMLGGISAWKSESLPTTSLFAPLQMAVSDTIVQKDTVFVGMVDTIHLTVTNRANSILHFTSITSLAGTEFSTDFNTSTSLEGPFDYTFSIYYTPTDTLGDSLTFRIVSNGGPVQFHIQRTGRMHVTAVEEWTIDILQLTMKSYPNPFISATTFEFELEQAGNIGISIINQSGQIIDELVYAGQKGRNQVSWDAKGVPPGVYYFRLLSGKQLAAGKMVKL